MKNHCFINNCNNSLRLKLKNNLMKWKNRLKYHMIDALK